MLNSVGLENYKCFKNNTSLDIAPLTVLCGVNSSGKSSLIKSILMLKQTASGRTQDPSVILSGDYVDCGTFADVINDGDKTRKEFVITNSFQIHNHKLEIIGKYIRKQDAKAFNELRRMYSNVKGEIKYFKFDLKLVVKELDDTINEFAKYISNNFIQSYRIDISAVDTKGEKIKTCKGYIFFENNEDEEKHKLSWNNIPGFSKAKKSFQNYKCTCTFNGLALTNIFAYDMPNDVKSVVPNILAISRIIMAQYDGIHYIAPLRNVPERTYIIKKNVTSVGISGEDTPILLAKLKNMKTMTQMFCPYTNKEEVDKNGYIKEEYHQIIQQWLDYFEIKKLDVQGENGAININLGKHNISDIGFGMSQLLPIITQGIVMDKEQTLMIEQPEIHLHPKMELQMADFLIQMARSDRNVIIETHSDHIVNRLIRRVMEDYSLNDLIKIYYIENIDGESVIHEPIEINQYKGTREDYENFFTQYTTETGEIIETGLTNMMRKANENNN